MDSMDQQQPQVPQTSAPQSPSSKKMWVLIGVAALLIVAAAVWYFTAGKNGRVLGVTTDFSYQAVFLTNGQVYFGKLAEKGDWVELSDIYYLQVTQNLQNAASGDQAGSNATPSTTGTPATQTPNIQLVKLGSELHGPKDLMHIDRDKILFWEDMKEDSKVVQAIKQHKSK